MSPETCMLWKSVGYVMPAADDDAPCTHGQQNTVTGSCNVVIVRFHKIQGHS